MEQPTPTDWRPFSEMPPGLKSAFFNRPGLPSWFIAHKHEDGKWHIPLGLYSAEVIEPERYQFLPLDIVPPLAPESCQ